MTLQMPPSVQARIQPNPDGCWLWTGHLSVDGYGKVYVGRMHLAHRFVYEALVGPIPAGLTLDHLCRNPACVNPEHLEPVTNRENTLRGIGLSAVNARKTLCLRGHAFDGFQRKQRRCRTCDGERDRIRRHAHIEEERERSRRRRAKKRAERLGTL